MIELNVYQLNIKIGSTLDITQIKVLDNSMEMDKSNYQVKIEGGKYTIDPRNSNRFTFNQITTYKVVFIVTTLSGNTERRECLVKVEDIEPKITVGTRSNTLTYKDPKMDIPGFIVSHPCQEYGTGTVTSSVRVFRTSFIGNDIDYTVTKKGDGYAVDLLEHGTDNNTQPCVGEYTVLYRAVSPTGLVCEKTLSFGVGAEAKAAVAKKDKSSSSEGANKRLGKTKINVVIVSLILIISLVLGIFFSNGMLDEIFPGKDDTTDQTTQEGEESTEENTEENEEVLEIVNADNALSAFSYGEAYLKTANSYQIEYVGNFFGEKEVAGKKYRVQETLRGKSKYYQVGYYNWLDVTKNPDANFGGNIYLRAVMPGGDIVLSQMNKREKKFNDEWQESTLDDFVLFLNRKAGKTYIKIDSTTLTKQTGFSFNGKEYKYSMELDADKALAEYRPAINSMFKIFIDEFSYTLKQLKVSGIVNCYGQPISTTYQIVCNVSVTYKGIDINISGAMLTFTEKFSQHNKVDRIEDEYVQPIG